MSPEVYGWVQKGGVWRHPEAVLQAQRRTREERGEVTPKKYRRHTRRLVPCPLCDGEKTARAAACKECYLAGSAEAGRARSKLARNLERTARQARTERPICGYCGCLLAAADEWCPACLVWAERVAAEATWTPIPYTDTPSLEMFKEAA